MKKVLLAIELVKNMGMRYTMYRIRHEIEKRTGKLIKRFPAKPKKKSFLSLKEWKNEGFKWVIPEKEKLSFEKNPSEKLKLKAEKILNGEIEFFSADWKELGLDYNWVTNPDSNYSYPNDIHWSLIPDFSEQTGDIKFVWEKSRFTYFHVLLNYDYHFGLDLSEFVFNEMDSWIQNNPINQGPNWRCSQEISLRLFNWFYALSYYQNSASLTEDRFNKYIEVIYWSLHHVYYHIDFSRIAVRNNHAITETLLLSISNKLFPSFEDTAKWSTEGKKWLEEEVDYQVYDDGTFLQFSMNYHRVLIQLLTLAVSFDLQHKVGYSSVIKSKAYLSLKYLMTCQDEKTGQLPNYGANDGALFFQWDLSEFRDYRPQLNVLHRLLTGENAYKLEDNKSIDWFHVEKINSHDFEKVDLRDGLYHFDKGGYIVIREANTLTFLKCGEYKDRPSQADNLHLDIWCNGTNILRDAGSYKYNTTKELQAYFFGTRSHNSVVLDGDKDQMLKGGRFIWYYWTKLKAIEILETETSYEVKADVLAYSYINKKIVHSRKLIKKKGTNEWQVEDEIRGEDSKGARQIWNTGTPELLSFDAKVKNISQVPITEKGWYSTKYGVKETSDVISFEFQNKIKTTIKANTN